ncbi:MAG: ABC transporter permease [Methanocellales archaeon]
MIIEVKGKLLTLYTILIYFFLFAPIAILVIFSFNASKLNFVWQGFTFYWYWKLLSNEAILSAFKNSLIVAILTTLLSTVIGTLLAFALVRYDFRGRGVLNNTIFLPVIIPEIIQGISLLVFFVWIGMQLGISTIVIAHTAFCISFVAIVVKARLHGLDRTLEEAAMDLGANKIQTFLKITLPLTMPGIIAGALLAFTLSLDDFVITFFTAGVGSTTLPLKIYSMIKFGITPEINAISTILLLVSIILMFCFLKLQRAE